MIGGTSRAPKTFGFVAGVIFGRFVGGDVSIPAA